MRKLDSALFDAVKENNTSAVLELLERGANPNAYQTFLFRGYQEYRRSVLHVALRATDERGFGVDVPENTELISALLDYGADVDARDTSEFTPLRLAALRGKLDTVRLLLDRGADINARDHQGQTPLMVAAFSGDEFLLEELLQRGADIDAKSNFDSTALMHAVNFLPKAVERVRVLLRYGANVNIRNQHDETVLSSLEHRLEIPEVAIIPEAAEVVEMLRKTTV